MPRRTPIILPQQRTLDTIILHLDDQPTGWWAWWLWLREA